MCLAELRAQGKAAARHTGVQSVNASRGFSCPQPTKGRLFSKKMVKRRLGR